MNYELNSSLLPDGSSFEFWETEPVWERELFVSASDPAASDENDGSAAAPFRTIGRAAALAEPGTRVLIHAGIYRECVSPARGGTDPEHMIHQVDIRQVQDRQGHLQGLRHTDPHP